MLMQIHPLIRKITSLSDQWKQETNELLYSHPLSNRILSLANDQGLSRRIGISKDFPNCFGTAFWLIGLTAFQYPEHFKNGCVAREFIDEYFVKITQEELDHHPREHIIFTNEIINFPVHAGIYLGRSCDDPAFFEQTDTGKPFQFSHPFFYDLRCNYYRLKNYNYNAWL